MKISVICPTFNSEHYIQRTINSLIGQTTSPFEVIFSDDGSSDQTVQIIKKNLDLLKSKDIKIVIIRNKHSGPGKNRNIAMFQASGDWLAFLDSDDSWENNKLERIMYYKNNNTKCNVFLNWEKFIKKNNIITLLKNGHNFNSRTSLVDQLYTNNFFSTSAVIIHKSLYLEFGGFDVYLPNGQDYDYWLKISPGLNLCVIPEYLGNYYETEGNITQRPYRKKIKSLIKITYRYKNNVSGISFAKKIFKIIVSKEWVKDLIKFNL